MNENAPKNSQEEEVDMSFVEMATGSAPKTPMEAVREAKEQGDPVAVAAAEKAADEKYIVNPELHDVHAQAKFEQNAEMMSSRVEKGISDLIAYLRDEKNPADEHAIEALVADVANDLSSIKNWKAKSGQESATVSAEVSNFELLNDPLLKPLKEALLAYPEGAYGAPLQAVKSLTEEHQKLVNRTKASYGNY